MVSNALDAARVLKEHGHEPGSYFRNVKDDEGRMIAWRVRCSCHEQEYEVSRFGQIAHVADERIVEP